MSNIPLAGRRVLVTRAAHQAGKLSDGLRAEGAEPVEVPVLEIAPPDNFEPLDRSLRQLNTYEWLIVTSANTVHALVERAAELNVGIGKCVTLKVAAIGAGTAAEARGSGFNVSLIPESYVAEALVEALETHAKGKKILLARASVARDVIPDALRAAGAIVEVVDAYQNRMPKNAPEQLRNAIAAGLDGATFTSSSSVSHLAHAASAAGLKFPFAGVPAISIGPVTSKTLRAAGWQPAIEATRSDVPGLIEATVHLLGRHSSGRPPARS